MLQIVPWSIEAMERRFQTFLWTESRVAHTHSRTVRQISHNQFWFRAYGLSLLWRAERSGRKKGAGKPRTKSWELRAQNWVLGTGASAADGRLWSNTSNQISSLCSMFEKPKCTVTWAGGEAHLRGRGSHTKLKRWGKYFIIKRSLKENINCICLTFLGLIWNLKHEIDYFQYYLSIYKA